MGCVRSEGEVMDNGDSRCRLIECRVALCAALADPFVHALRRAREASLSQQKPRATNDGGVVYVDDWFSWKSNGLVIKF